MANKKDSPAANEERYAQIEESWGTLAPSATFGKRTLAQLQAAIQPSKAARVEVARIQSELDAALIERDSADAVSLKACDETVKGVVGDPDFGDDCALYEAMGYKRKSDYVSGLTRKKKTPPSA